MSGQRDERLARLQRQLEEFRDEREWEQFHTLKNLAAAVAIEAAELQELFLWSSGIDDQSEVLARRRADAEAEVADVLIQLLNFASAAEIDVLAAATAKLEENARRYPVEVARGSAEKSPRSTTP